MSVQIATTEDDIWWNRLALWNNLGDNGVNRQANACQFGFTMNTEALSITVYGLPGTTEYKAAERLRDIIRRAALPRDSGTISIHTDVYFTGQKREQIDILLHAHFPSEFTRRIRLPGWSETAEVLFLDILAVIEVKAHGRDKVDLIGTNARVLYRDGWKSASAQSNAQIHSVKPYIEKQLGWTPYVCNLIFFPNLVKAEFPSQPHNYLASDSTCDDLLEKLCLSRKLTASPRSGRAPFYCASTQDMAEIQKRHLQLQDLLGDHRHALHVSPPSVKYRTPRPFYRRKSVFFRPIGFRRGSRRGLSRIPGILAGGMVCLIVLGVLLNWFVSMAFPTTPTSATSYAQATVPTLDTCNFVTPSCVCMAKTTFHRGSMVSIRFAGMHRTPASEVVRDPRGKSITLAFHEMRSTSAYLHGACFVAKYPISRQAAPGFYAVQVTSRDNTDRSASALARGFEVTR